MKTSRTAVARRRRNSARAALYASLAVTAGLLAATYAWMQPRLQLGALTSWAWVDWAEYPEVQMLREYVAINTAMPPAGDPLAGARWFADQVAALGLDPVVETVGDEANVWAVLEGDSPEAVVLHHHIDVEPVPDPTQWAHDPFAGVIDPPYIYGRGTFDMKSVAVAQLFAVRRLIESVEESGAKPARSVILLATTAEETGSDFGTKWILRRHPELVERFAVVLTEGGAVESREIGDLKYWGTEFAQKRIVDVLVCGPRPAVESLREVMLGRAGEPKLVPEVERFLASYAPTRDAADLRRRLSHPRELLRDRPAFEDLSRYQKSFFRNELHPGGVYSDGDGAILRLRALLLPGEDPETALETLVPDWARHGLTVQVFDEGGAALGSPLEHWAYQGIDRLMRRQRPDVVHGPLINTLSATDARFLRAAGIQAFGFSPFGVVTAEVVDSRSFGTVNERMVLPGFVDGVELYAEVLAELVR